MADTTLSDLFGANEKPLPSTGWQAQIILEGKEKKAFIDMIMGLASVTLDRLLHNNGHLSHLLLALSTKAADPNSETAVLHRAALAYIIQTGGISPDTCDPQDRYSALRNIAILGHEHSLEAAKILLDLGADPNGVDQKGNSVLHIAAEYNPCLVPLLLDYRAKPNELDEDGNSPLMRLAERAIRSPSDSNILNAARTLMWHKNFDWSSVDATVQRLGQNIRSRETAAATTAASLLGLIVASRPQQTLGGPAAPANQ